LWDQKWKKLRAKKVILDWRVCIEEQIDHDMDTSDIDYTYFNKFDRF
jgi:hypothetical protein